MNRASPSAAEFIELLGIPPKESAGWDPFFLQIVDETPLHAGVLFRDLALGVYLSGRHKIRRQIGANPYLPPLHQYLVPPMHLAKIIGWGDADEARRAGREAVTFPARHHRLESWFVPCSTLVPILIYLGVWHEASTVVMILAPGWRNMTTRTAGLPFASPKLRKS